MIGASDDRFHNLHAISFVGLSFADWCSTGARENRGPFADSRVDFRQSVTKQIRDVIFIKNLIFVLNF